MGLLSMQFVGRSVNIGLAHLYDLVQKELSRYNYDVMVVYAKEKQSGPYAFEHIIKK